MSCSVTMSSVAQVTFPRVDGSSSIKACLSTKCLWVWTPITCFKYLGGLSAIGRSTIEWTILCDKWHNAERGDHTSLSNVGFRNVEVFGLNLSLAPCQFLTTNQSHCPMMNWSLICSSAHLLICSSAHLHQSYCISMIPFIPYTFLRHFSRRWSNLENFQRKSQVFRSLNGVFELRQKYCAVKYSLLSFLLVPEQI